MTDYTPTLEEVRARYQAASRNKFGHRDPKRITDAEFDRMLAKVRAEAWDEGYDRGFYDREQLTGDSRDASEGASSNPYSAEAARIREEGSRG